MKKLFKDPDQHAPTASHTILSYFGPPTLPEFHIKSPAFSIGEEIGNNIGIARCCVEGAQKFTLNVLGESSSLATPLNHLMGDLFGGGGDQIVRLQPQFRHQAVQGLFSEIPF